MIKKTLYFGNPSYLSLQNGQLSVRLPEVEKNETLSEQFKKQAVATIPVEDIGVVVLDEKQITITQALLAALIENNVAIIACDATHHPSGLMMPLSMHTIQNERFRAQIESSEPLKKQLWQQTVDAKIRNQADLLRQKGIDTNNMIYWAKSVKSGDPDNYEARAAAFYWKNLFNTIPDFTRGRHDLPPNNILNYGYAILRAIVARGLVGSGLLPTLGIHHTNRYNAYCLADDIMEPYRPFVDKLVCDFIAVHGIPEKLETKHKKEMLVIPVLEITIESECSPLMVGLQRTTASLAKCYEGRARKIIYPELLHDSK